MRSRQYWGETMTKQKTFDYLQDLGRKKPAVVTSVETDSAFLGLVIGQQTMYLPIQYIYKVLSKAAITAVGHTQPWLQGIVQVDGNIYSVFNLGRWVDATIDSAALGDNTLIALSQTNGYYAILVEEILGIVHFIPQEAVAETALTVDYQGTDNHIFSILSVEKLINSTEFADFSIFNH